MSRDRTVMPNLLYESLEGTSESEELGFLLYT